MSSQGFPSVPEMLTDAEDKSFSGREHRRKIALALNGTLRGKFNCTLDVLVTASAATTTITDSRISPFSWLAPMAQDATGSADIVAGIYFNTFLNGSCVMHHRNAVGVRSLRIVLLG